MKKLNNESQLDGLIINSPIPQEHISNNEFYFYSEVTTESIYQLNKSISSIEKNCLTVQSEFGLETPPPIKIYINSEGGELFSALTTVDRIKSSKVPVHTYVEGLVASAATLISICGKNRYMRKNAVMMVHQIRTFCGGTHENVKDEAKNLELMADIIKRIYLENSNFEEAELDELLKRDLYLSATECLKYNLIDEII